MDTEQNRADDDTDAPPAGGAGEQTTTGDESPEEFKEQVENDPSTATSPDEGDEQYRGG